MTAFNRPAILFSLKSYAAAMVGLYIAFSLGLNNPFWTLITTYMVSQSSAGAVVSKARYRVMGTIVGACIAVYIVPLLSQSPEVSAAVIAVWLGMCIFLSTIDRTPRSYLFLMAGVTACVIVFPSLAKPDTVFETAVARIEEITLGIVCSTVVHMTVLPNSSRRLLIAKIDLVYQDVVRWTAEFMEDNFLARQEDPRRKLPYAMNEIHDLLTHAENEGHLHSHRRQLFLAVLGQLERLLSLTPEFSSLLIDLRSDRLLNARISQLLQEVRTWLLTGPEEDRSALHTSQLIETCKELQPEIAKNMLWSDLLRLSLLTNLSELIQGHQVCRDLLPDALNENEDGGSKGNHYPRGASVRAIERDYGGALLISVSATLALFLASRAWFFSGWPDGSQAVMMAGVFYGVYAGFGNPALALKNKFVGVVVRMWLGAFYVSAVLPSINGFASLAAALAPALVISGIFLCIPKYNPLALNLIIGLASPAVISNHFTGDFIGYLNNGLGTLTGIMFSMLILTMVQQLWLDKAERRLIKATWNDIAGGAYIDTDRWRSRMLDRLALMENKIVRADVKNLGYGDDARRSLAVGSTLAMLYRAVHTENIGHKSEIAAVLRHTSEYFGCLGRSPRCNPPQSLNDEIDRTLHNLLEDNSPELQRSIILALTRLKWILFLDPSVSQGSTPFSLPAQS